MPPDHVRLDAVAQAVADGDVVDWDRLESTADEDDRAAVRHLRLVARVAEVHRTVQILGPQSSPVPPHASAAPEPSSHPTWGPLILSERIGGGTHGDVYRARDPRLDRDVALKLLRPAPSVEGAPGQELIGEARLLARIRHPHVVTVHGADCFDGRVGLWMEFVRGRSLDREVFERGPLGAQEAAVIGLDVCAALAAVHQAGLVHRDVKAGNVVREEAGRIVLMDFGTGCIYSDPAEFGGAGLAGTPLYTAPEVLAGQSATPSSDLYSLGVLLYYLVTGSYPVVATTIDGVRDAHQRGERRPLRDARPDLPGAFIAVVERALEPDSRNRFSSAGVMEVALAGALVPRLAEDGGMTASESARSEPAPTRHDLLTRIVPNTWRARVAVFAAVALLLAAVAVAYRNWSRTGEAGAALGFRSRDWVLITAFDNRTGDPKLDGTVEYAIERELGNSHFVNIVPRERIGDALALMRKPFDTRLGESIGREVCLRDGGIRTMVAGRVEKLGGVFDVSARVVDPASGRTLLAAAVDVSDEEHILEAVHNLSIRVRASLGETRREIEATDQALEKATTRSLKALQLYSRGMAVIAEPGSFHKWRVAKTLFEQATREDPEFASAYAYLSWAWQPSLPWGDRAKELAASERAFRLSDQATERERLFIRATYFGFHGRSEEARAEYEALVRLYPDHYWAVNNLARIYGATDEAVPYWLRLAGLRPKGFAENKGAAKALIFAGRVAEATAYVQRARDIGMASGLQPDEWLECFPIWRRWVRGDVAGAMTALREMATAADTDGNAELRRALNIWFITLGRLREADAALLKRLAEIERQGINPAGSSGKLSEVMPEILLAWNAELRGDRRAARTWMQHVSGRVKRAERVMWWETIVLLARVGLDAEVQRSLAEPNPTWLRREEYVSWARGELALAEGRPAEAVALLAEVLKSFGADYITRQLAVQTLSSAWQANRGPEAALDVIVNNISSPDRSPYQYLNLSAWLDLQASRAGLLRRLGRPAEAQPIEAELRKYLAYADADLLIVKQLAKQTH